MIHHVYANRSNVGDWLSARGIQSLLAVPVREHLCDTPFAEATLADLAKAGPNDFIVIGGGGLFMDYFTPFWEGFRTVAARVPFCVWGAGCCDRKRAESSAPLKLLEEIVAQSRLCVVRDELTRRLLRRCELPPPVVCPTVVAVSSSEFGGTRTLLHVDHYDNVGEEIYQRMVAMAIAHAQQTGRKYRQTNNLIPAGHNGALSRTLELYASADLVLTSRLHGCILALAMGRRVLMVSGDRKVESFMQAAGLEEWVCDLDEIESLPARLEDLPQQPLPREFIEQARKQNRAVADRVRALLPATSERGTRNAELFSPASQNPEQ